MGKKGKVGIDWGPMAFFFEDLGKAYAERFGPQVKKCYETYLALDAALDVEETQKAVEDLGFGKIPKHMVRRAVLYALHRKAPILAAHLLLREICFLGMDVEDKKLHPWLEFLDFAHRVEKQDSPMDFWFFFIRNIAALWGIPEKELKEYYRVATEVHK